ncbi:MAG: NAD-dependent epimerase/dehydratase family protein [Patescibacteria group bacterium]|jgi:UDP-glucose 4-epimerase
MNEKVFMNEKVKNILVTGGAGFIGTNLCRRLADIGHNVISLDNYFTGSKANHLPKVKYYVGHTKDIAQIIFEKIDIVFHLGEYARVEKSFTEPDVVWDLNVLGTFAVAEFCRKNKATLIYAGSSTKFADNGFGRKQSPYAYSKTINSEFIKNYGDWYGLDYAITYFYNVYGPGERSNNYGTVIEIFKQQYLAGKPLTVVSPGTQERIFTHVDDIVDGLLLIGEKGSGDDFGLGMEKVYTVLEIAQMFNSEIIMLPERQGNRQSAYLDTTKSNALGWRAKKDVADYIEEIVKTRKTK